MRTPSVFTAPSSYVADLEGAAVAPHQLAVDAALSKGCAAIEAVDAQLAGAAATHRRKSGLPQLKPQPVDAVAASGGLAGSPSLITDATTGEKEESLATAAAVDVAMQDAVELLISGSSTAPAYELRCELGRGKYGRVYLIEECVQHRLLAVKASYNPLTISVSHKRQKRLLPPQPPAPSSQQRGDGGCGRVVAAGKITSLNPTAPLLTEPRVFPSSNEVRCLQECHSPFIVRLEGAEKGEHGEDLLIMEYVDGGDLRQEIRRRRGTKSPFTENEAVFVFLQLAMAVDHVHQLNMMHHDIKPENILLSSTGIIKIADFGFARKYRKPITSQIAVTSCGTPYYLSPEALRGDRYSAKSEMWALGVILYELLTLSGPFVASTRSELCEKVQKPEYDPLPSTYSSDVRALCYQLLSVDPEARPSTQDLFHDNEYVREKLNALRRTSECSTRMTAEEKDATFRSICAALRRPTPVERKQPSLYLDGRMSHCSAACGDMWCRAASTGPQKPGFEWHPPVKSREPLHMVS